VRVLARTIRRAQPLLEGTVDRARTLFRDRTRSVRRVTRQLIAAARRRSEVASQQVQEHYQQLLVLTQQVVHQAQQVQQHLQTQPQRQPDRLARCLTETLQSVVPRVEPVIRQTTRRVIHGESVPAGEKVVSVFEPHTAIIRKGKAGKPVEFGRVLWLGETEGGIMTQARLLDGNPDAAAELVPSLDHHIQQFGRPPQLLAGDGKLATPTNEQTAQQRGVTQVVLPRPGRKAPTRLAHERQRWFRRGRNWRAGIEGRSSGLKRRHGLNRCRYHGTDGMERWVSWGVIVHNLRMIAQHQAAKAAR
jgi:transposase, IS5 family